MVPQKIHPTFVYKGIQISRYVYVGVCLFRVKPLLAVPGETKRLTGSTLFKMVASGRFNVGGILEFKPPDLGLHVETIGWRRPFLTVEK